MRYAMILKQKVIEVVESETVPVFPPDTEGNVITAVECDDTVVRGMVYSDETGEFSEYVYPVPKPSILARIEAAVQASEDLKAFYEEVTKEAGL